VAPPSSTTRQIPSSVALGHVPAAPADGEHGRRLGNIPSQARRGTNRGHGDASDDPGQGQSTPSSNPIGIWQESPQGWAQRASGAMAEVGPSRPGPSRSGMWEEATESPPAIRPGGRADDEGGPGDTPARVAWLRAGRGTGYG